MKIKEITKKLNNFSVKVHKIPFSSNKFKESNWLKLFSVDYPVPEECNCD